MKESEMMPKFQQYLILRRIRYTYEDLAKLYHNTQLCRRLVGIAYGDGFALKRIQLSQNENPWHKEMMEADIRPSTIRLAFQYDRYLGGKDAEVRRKRNTVCGRTGVAACGIAIDRHIK